MIFWWKFPKHTEKVIMISLGIGKWMWYNKIENRYYYVFANQISIYFLNKKNTNNHPRTEHKLIIYPPIHITYEANFFSFFLFNRLSNNFLGTLSLRKLIFIFKAIFLVVALSTRYDVCLLIKPYTLQA